MTVELPARNAVLSVVKAALVEDVGAGDVTSERFIPAGAQAAGSLVAGERLTVCGLPVAEMVFRQLDPKCRVRACAREGDEARRGDIIARVSGRARALLSGERTALNFVQRLSGIATLTGKFVKKVKGTGARIYDTRKTAPGLRALEKYAVRAGAGCNHRAGLHDHVLLKDNHIAFLNARGKDAFKLLAEEAGADRGPVEVEVSTVKDALRALAAGVDVIMLDNMELADMKEAVRAVRAQAARRGTRPPQLEASGGVTLETARAVAHTGVDRISVGALTHSARAADISFELS